MVRVAVADAESVPAPESVPDSDAAVARESTPDPVSLSDGDPAWAAVSASVPVAVSVSDRAETTPSSSSPVPESTVTSASSVGTEADIGHANGHHAAVGFGVDAQRFLAEFIGALGAGVVDHGDLSVAWH